MLKQILSVLFVLIATIISQDLYASTSPTINEQKIISHASNLDPKALQSAVHAYKWALKNGYVKNPYILTVIDFNLPSYKKRAWVIDLKNSKVLMNLYTTHGKNSGTSYASHFSNSPSSDATSLGAYTTLNTYMGKHGFSERLQGLEKGVNDNAFKRAIVIHSADYATPQYIKAYGQAGRSWGCFAISPAESKAFVNYTKNGSVIFAYADQEKHDPMLSTVV